ncbi:MAG TPA: two-component regulator propeller domain-containing protein, partial [Bacteroidales bacterium]|nr:two-component regulator propeller domain-containing protein [Bacteroidales bacterium]
MRFFLTVYLCFCSIFIVCAQQTFNLKNYSKSDGLSDNYIFDVIEDSRGVIWFPTTYGINTFNGTDFYSYTKENSFSTHLIRNDFVCAHTYTDGRLFFAGFNGSIMYYDHANGDFHDVSLSYVSMYEYP